MHIFSNIALDGSSIGSLSAQGTLDATSGAALAAGALSSGSSMVQVPNSLFFQRSVRRWREGDV